MSGERFASRAAPETRSRETEIRPPEADRSRRMKRAAGRGEVGSRSEAEVERKRSRSVTRTVPATLRESGLRRVAAATPEAARREPARAEASRRGDEAPCPSPARPARLPTSRAVWGSREADKDRSAEPSCLRTRSYLLEQ